MVRSGESEAAAAPVVWTDAVEEGTGVSSPAGRGPRRLMASTRAAYAADWGLFVDWCTAAGHPPLPAKPEVVLQFLSENPAAPITFTRRVAAIDHHHRAGGQPPPGRDIQVMRWLRLAAGKPADPPTPRRLAPDQLHAVLGRIPTHGWPAGVFGRRDRLLLLLVHAAGLTRGQLHQLRDSDFTVTTRPDGQAALHVRAPAAAPITLPATEAMTECPICTWRAWHTALDLIHHHYPRTRTLRHAFTRTRPFTTTTPHYPHHRPETLHVPIFIALDQHGYPTPHQPLSTRALTYLTSPAGQQRDYRILPQRETALPGKSDTAAQTDDRGGRHPAQPPRNKQDVRAAHAQALARRRDEQQRLQALDGVFDDLDARIQACNTAIEELAASARADRDSGG